MRALQSVCPEAEPLEDLQGLLRLISLKEMGGFLFVGGFFGVIFGVSFLCWFSFFGVCCCCFAWLVFSKFNANATRNHLANHFFIVLTEFQPRIFF